VRGTRARETPVSSTATAPRQQLCSGSFRVEAPRRRRSMAAGSKPARFLVKAQRNAQRRCMLPYGQTVLGCAPRYRLINARINRPSVTSTRRTRRVVARQNIHRRSVHVSNYSSPAAANAQSAEPQTSRPERCNKAFAAPRSNHNGKRRLQRR